MTGAFGTLTNNLLRKSPTSSVVDGPPMFKNTTAVPLAAPAPPELATLVAVAYCLHLELNCHPGLTLRDCLRAGAALIASKTDLCKVMMSLAQAGLFELQKV
jgi:hypothetical protein